MHTDKKLGYNCPVNIGSMPKCSGGYACQKCEKTVFDYSKMSLGEFHKEAEKNAAISQCGIYKAYQLDGVYGDWRDKVTKMYRRTIQKASANKRMIVLLPLIAGFMFLVGCGRRGVCGMMYEGEWSKSTDQIHLDSSKTDLPSKQR